MLHNKLKKMNMERDSNSRWGPKAARRWKDDPAGILPRTYYDRTEGGVHLKFPRCKHNSRDRGVYMLSLKWFADGRNSVGRAGKEFPHPHTVGVPFNTHNPEPVIGDIKDGKWHGFLAAVYNDIYTGAPTMKLWYNPHATQKREDYIYLGTSEDAPKKKMKPGPLLPWSIEWAGNSLFKVEHVLEIRIDDIPKNQLQIRNMFATEVIVEKVPRDRDIPAFVCRSEAAALREARILFDKLEDKLRELEARLMVTVRPSFQHSQILAEIARLREKLLSAIARLNGSTRVYNDCMSRNRPIGPRPFDISTGRMTGVATSTRTRRASMPGRVGSNIEKEICS